jgi:hypothetical protein
MTTMSVITNLDNKSNIQIIQVSYHVKNNSNSRPAVAASKMQLLSLILHHSSSLSPVDLEIIPAEICRHNQSGKLWKKDY